MSSKKKPFKRLSKSVVPTNYNISLQPNFGNFFFDGESIIDIKVNKECKKIKLNCAHLQISKAVYIQQDDAEEDADIVYDEVNETASFKFKSSLKVGHGKLKLQFQGILNDKLRGFYRSKYVTPSGEERYAAVTHFEATGARWAFPCWDEPAFKATFEISIIASKEKTILSNMDVKEEINVADGLVKKSFNKTPIMSTYIIAFAVGEFCYVEETLPSGLPVRVYTPLEKSSQGKFALEIALKAVPYYEEYFGIKYLLPKLDLIGFPDFPIGAMENWGLITYRETCLLIDPAESSSFRKEQVALVVAHEIAHMWFGNLSTMVWWTDLWLKEGFASLMEYVCVHHCHPEYNIWESFISSEMAYALTLDALHNSHPIEVKVESPGEIDEIFDGISYNKGASIIRMLHGFLGEEDFRKGLHSYLLEFDHKNATTDDLWFHLGKASNKDVDKIMSTWTRQMGFPVLTVSTEHVKNQRILKISQKRFTADGKGDSNMLWSVPINISTSNHPNQPEYKVLMSDPEMVVFLDHLPDDAWIKINPGQIGFYRTCYSQEMIKSLIPAIPILSSVDRLGLENDLFALSVAGVSKTTDFLDLLTGYKEEENYAVWADIDKNIGDLSIILQNTDYFDDFNRFVLNLYKPISEKLGWEASENEGHHTSMLRGLIITRLGAYHELDIVNKARELFKDHIANIKAIDPNLRSSIFQTVAANGTQETVDELIALYKQTSLNEERCRILSSIGCVNNSHSIQDFLKFALSDVRSQDLIFAVEGCIRSLEGRKLAWSFVKSNWDELFQRYAGSTLLKRFIKGSTSWFVTKEDAIDVKKFFENHPTQSGERTVKQALEKIELNCNWLAREHENIRDYLCKTSSK